VLHPSQEATVSLAGVVPVQRYDAVAGVEQHTHDVHPDEPETPGHQRLHARTDGRSAGDPDGDAAGERRDMDLLNGCVGSCGNLGRPIFR